MSTGLGIGGKEEASLKERLLGSCRFYFFIIIMIFMIIMIIWMMIIIIIQYLQDEQERQPIGADQSNISVIFSLIIYYHS